VPIGLHGGSNFSAKAFWKLATTWGNRNPSTSHTEDPQRRISLIDNTLQVPAYALAIIACVMYMLVAVPIHVTQARQSQWFHMDDIGGGEDSWWTACFSVKTPVDNLGFFET
jgi:small ligand-binding sensory domain FIST